ncbi:MAG: alpha/beta fold hydrolase [Thermoplasmata archaeon]
MGDVQSGLVQVPGGEIFYERRGQGPPLLLIHSAFLDRRMWDPQFESYSKKYSVIRYDLRGHGRSSAATGSSVNVEDLNALADHLGLQGVFVLGASMGASIAAAWTARAPSRVRGLVLVGGAPADLDPTPEEEERFLEGAIGTDEKIMALAREGRTTELVEAILDAWAPAVDGATRVFLRSIAADNVAAIIASSSDTSSNRPRSYPVADTLRRSPVPMLLLCGDRDDPALHMIMGRFTQQLLHAHFVELKGADHTPNLSAPAEFDRQVLDFLDRTPERPAAAPP